MRRAALVSGLGLVAALFALLIATFDGGAFTTHMIVHMGIVAVAAPLIAAGLPQGPTLRLSPLLASFLELVVVWLWHVPALRIAADGSLALSLVEQASFLLAGLLLWHACLRPQDGRLAGTMGLLFTSMHMTLLGVLLSLAPRALYGEGTVTCFGVVLARETDQQLGGVIMLTVGALAYLTGGIWQLAGLLRDPPATASGGTLMRIGWKHLGALVVAGVLLGGLVAWSGVIGIRASTGHWKVTDLVLHFVMRSSVRTAALGTEVPPFTEAMLPMAAGHFEAGCAQCHGSPAMARPKSTAGMLPPPPDLVAPIPTWSDAQLFEIVRHGVRYTGMPAWPATGRDDEAWAMVAFLRRYPDLDAAGYRALSGLPERRAGGFQAVIDGCNACHAPDRLGPGSLIPTIHGQSLPYLEQALQAYAAGTRQSGVMAVALEGRSADELMALARHFAGQPAPETPAPATSPEGEALARTGDPARGIPACLSCHDKPEANPAYPRLSGQSAAYLATQLHLFKAKTRGGGPFHPLMIRAAAGTRRRRHRGALDLFRQPLKGDYTAPTRPAARCRRAMSSGRVRVSSARASAAFAWRSALSR